MKVKRTSSISQAEHEMEIDVTQDQLDLYEQGVLGTIQDAFPHLTPDEREFIMTGITADEWDKLFGEDND